MGDAAFIVERMTTKDDLKKFRTKDGVHSIVCNIIEEKLRPFSAELVSNRRSSRFENKAQKGGR